MSKVTTTSSTYQELYDSNLKKYGHYASAAALFYNKGQGLRLECPGIRKEFIDQVEYGKDPEGTLFFYALTDFPDNDTKTNYDVYYSTASADDDKAAVVRFYSDNHSDKPYAVFVAKDKAGTVNFTVNSHQGVWNELKVGVVTSTLSKQTDLNEFTLNLDAISKKVTWTIDNFKPEKTSIKTHGLTYFKDISKIKAGEKPTIDYNGDRIVFYKSKDFTQKGSLIAYFIPEEVSSSKSLGTTGVSGITGTWANA